MDAIIIRFTNQEIEAHRGCHLSKVFLLCSYSIVSNFLQPHGWQHTRLHCPSPFPIPHVHRVGDAIQPSHPLSSPSPPILNLSQHQGLFKMSQLFASGGQNIGVSASTSIIPMDTQDFQWTPLGWTGWIFLQSKGHSRVFSNTTVQKHQFFSA